MSIFSGISFSFPGLLAVAPLFVAGLFYAYKRRGRGARLLVSSTMLLRQLQQVSHARSTFVPPMRFFVELAVVLCLALAGAGISLQRPGERIAVLIDNSLSMSVEAPEDLSGHSRLELAREHAADFIALLPEQARVTVYVTTPGQRLHRRDLSGGEAIDALDSIEAVSASDTLDTVVAEIAESGEFKQIAIFTDKRAVGSSTDTDRQLSTHTVFDPRHKAQNLAISSASYRAGAERVPATLEARVSSFALESATAQLVLHGFSAERRWKQLAAKPLTVQPGETATVQFTLDSAAQSCGAFKVALTVKAERGQRLNLLARDDLVYITPSAPSTGATLVSSSTANELGLTAVKTLSFAEIRPEEYAPEKLKKGLVIFHRFVPQQLPSTNTLIVMPPEGNNTVPVRRKASALPVTRWSSSHPLLNYLVLPALELPQAEILEENEWLRGIVHTPQGPVVLAGELNGQRIVAAGFEIFPFRGREAPLRTVFTLNALKWLTDIATESGYLRTFSSLPPSEGAQVLNSLSDGETLRAAAGEPLVLRTPGLFETASSDATQLIAVGLLDPEESNTIDPGSYVVPVFKAARSSPEGTERASFARIAALLALLFLAMDTIWNLVAALRRSGRASARS